MIDPTGSERVPFVTDAGVASWMPTDKKDIAGKLVALETSVATSDGKPAQLELHTFEDKSTNGRRLSFGRDYRR
jgi:hypothetical protein